MTQEAFVLTTGIVAISAIIGCTVYAVSALRAVDMEALNQRPYSAPPEPPKEPCPTVTESPVHSVVEGATVVVHKARPTVSVSALSPCGLTIEEFDNPSEAGDAKIFQRVSKTKYIERLVAAMKKRGGKITRTQAFFEVNLSKQKLDKIIEGYPHIFTLERSKGSKRPKEFVRFTK